MIPGERRSINAEKEEQQTMAVEQMSQISKDMSSRAKSNDPLLDSELESILTSLQNVIPAEHNNSESIHWEELRELLREVGHQSHKDWKKTGQWATQLKQILLRNANDDLGLTDTFRFMFHRVLTEGNWAGALEHISSKAPKNSKPWAVLVTGVNGIRKTTSMYQTWFQDLLNEAIVPPQSSSSSSKPIPKESLPTGTNSFFRQLDHMIATLTNEDFKRLYVFTALALQQQQQQQQQPTEDDVSGMTPSAEIISQYSNWKAAIFSRFRTLSEMLGIVLVREACRLGSNVMVETSGRDVAMFHYVDANFPSEKYNKIAFHFIVNDLSCAEESVDRRMVGEIRDGIEALNDDDKEDTTTTTDPQSKSEAVRKIILANAGGPYGSEVLRDVQKDSDSVWESILENKDGDDSVGSDWYKATIAIDAHMSKDWTASAIRPDGTKGTVYSFERRK